MIRLLLAIAAPVVAFIAGAVWVTLRDDLPGQMFDAGYRAGYRNGIDAQTAGG